MYQNQISEDRTIEEDIEVTIEMIIAKEVGVGLEKGHIQAISEMTEVTVIVGQAQYQDQVLIETELGVISVKNKIISQKIVQQ